ILGVARLRALTPAETDQVAGPRQNSLRPRRNAITPAQVRWPPHGQSRRGAMSRCGYPPPSRRKRIVRTGSPLSRPGAMLSQPGGEQAPSRIRLAGLIERRLVACVSRRGVDVGAGGEEPFGCPPLAATGSPCARSTRAAATV